MLKQVAIQARGGRTQGILLDDPSGCGCGSGVRYRRQYPVWIWQLLQCRRWGRTPRNAGRTRLVWGEAGLRGHYLVRTIDRRCSTTGQGHGARAGLLLCYTGNGMCRGPIDRRGGAGGGSRLQLDRLWTGKCNRPVGRWGGMSHGMQRRRCGGRGLARAVDGRREAGPPSRFRVERIPEHGLSSSSSPYLLYPEVAGPAMAKEFADSMVLAVKQYQGVRSGYPYSDHRRHESEGDGGGRVYKGAQRSSVAYAACSWDEATSEGAV
jgi:hypothetical protein